MELLYLYKDRRITHLTCQPSVQLHKLLNVNFYICVAKNYKVRNALLNSWTSLRVNGGGRVTEFGQFQYDLSCLKHNVKLTLRRLMSYIYGAPILDVSRSHTTTQHSR